MKKKLLQFLLLFTLFFHIVHDTVLAEEMDTSTSIHTYVQEQISFSQSSDICDYHHIFHFMAIIEKTYLSLSTPTLKSKVLHQKTFYTPPFQKTSIKPPIA
ncbi:MAG: hypothetical protein COA92_06025 [Sulfurovum sp.]|nr:MAG: hypothetical protein COA92_06025 [Sulfurovum sp.]